MGMFDWTRCDCKTPDGKVGTVGQTKEFGCVMKTVIITELGKLLIPVGRYVSVPKEQRECPDAPEGSFESMFGSIMWEGCHEQHLTFTGLVNVDAWHAVFLRGQLVGFQEYDDASVFYPWGEST